ncbi:NEDD4-binding protein 2-like [Saccostrea echinata]|uniref:NEDD4-binding protein 2-like n=1 Tax=Saccostrea echinata TaxID=191078 RepID=UPI002A83E833|nr:NEDD4-binding protein 2-like [Saccostrea echinata]
MRRQNLTREVNQVKAQAPLTGSQRQQEVNDQIFRHVQDMFDGKVDGDVVFIILQELEWNVEKAIDTLCTMCGSQIDATKKKSKLTEIARDVLCLDKKNKFSHQSTQNLMPSEFPALGSLQSSEKPNSRESTLNVLDAQRLDKKSLLVSQQKDQVGNAITNVNSGNEFIRLTTSSAYNAGISSPGSITPAETSPRHVGVIGEKLNRKSRDSSLSPGSFESPSKYSEEGKNIESQNGLPKPELTDYRSERLAKYDDVQGGSFPSFHDNSGSADVALDFAQLDPRKSNKLQSSHNSLDDIDENFEEELDFNSFSKKVSTPSLVPFSEGIGHSILAGALNLTNSQDNGMPTSVGEKRPMLGTKQLPHQVSPALVGSNVPISSLWPHNTNDRSKSSLDEKESSYVLSNFSQSSAHGTSRYSFANKNAFNLRHDSGEFDIDSLLKEGSLNGLDGASHNQYNSDQLKEIGRASQDYSDQLSVDNSEAAERPNSTEMQLPVLSFELSVTAKEFVPRLQKEDDFEQADEQSEKSQPHFVMPKMGKPLDGGMPIPQPRIPNQFVPGFRLPRAPFGMQMRPPWPPRGGRGSIPRGMPPWMKHFPSFPEPRGAPPFLPPGGVLPVQRSSKSTAEANEREIERVRQRIASGAKVLVVLRGLPGSGKSTLARQLVGDGQILSTDDYFWENEIYNFDVSKLADAHEWNRKRVAAAMEEKCTPVIIDNTNTQSWEIKPYLKLGKAFSYEMELLEPNTPWKYSVKELARRNDHGVPKEHIQKMKERYQRDLTVELILGSPFKKKIENGEKPKDIEFSPADFPELRNSQADRGSPFNSSRKDSLDQEVFLTRPDDFKESESTIKLRRNSGDSGRECSTIGSDTDSEKRVEKEFDSDNRQSPIPTTIGYVARSHVAMSSSNIHKQLEIITKRKTLMSPPVSQGFRQKEDMCQKTVEDFTVSFSTTDITDTKTAGDDIEGKVDSLIMENVGSSWNSDFDQDKIIDELKSWILFMDIDPTQHMQVEKMIEEKIKILSKNCDNDQSDIKEQNSADESNVISDFRETAVSENEEVWDTPMDQRSKKKNLHKNANLDKDLKPDSWSADNLTREEVLEKGNIESSNKGQMAETIPKNNMTSELSNIKASEQLYWSTQKDIDCNIMVSSDSWENKEPLGQRQVSNLTQRNCQASDAKDEVTEKSDAQSLMHNVVSLSAMKSKPEVVEPISDTFNLSKTLADPSTEPRASALRENVETSESTPKEPSSVVCEASKISLQEDNVHEKDKARSLKKNNKRKMAARFPLLNDSDRAKLAVNDWTAIKVDTLDDVKSDIAEKRLSVNDNNLVRKVHSETEITPQDLNIMHDLSRGMTKSSTKLCNVVIIEGKEWKVNSSNNYSEKNSKSSNVMTVHRSTMTEDFLEADIEFLKNSFPTIPEVDLKDVLQSCDNNVEWAADIILDWNFHDISLSQEDKNKYLDSIFKVQHLPKSPTIPARSRSSSSICVGEQSNQPALLIDICMKYLEDTNIATKEDIENQLIANSEKRMRSYESNIRICQQFSRGSEGDEIFIEDEEFSRMILQELEAIAEDEPATDSISVQNVSKIDQSLNSSYVDSPQSGVFEEVVDTCQGTVSDAGFVPVMESPANLTLSLELPSDFIQALLSLFGSVGNLTPVTAEALTIPVDYITAQRLHQCLKTEHVEIHVNRRQQISDDEAFAQQLHSEMNNSTCKTTQKSMHLIMQEQLKEEERKANLNEDLKASGFHNTIGNKMKKQKLHEEFPAIDPSVLDEIFQANCFSYADTVRAVKGSLGCNEPPKTVMTAEAADKYERKLIEAAKQQSLQEMIDSYTYHPKVKNEYQSAENPEYEDIRGEANLHYRLRHECFQKAQEAYRRGMKQVAQFYSNQGHLHTKKIKEANENAAQMILSRRVEYLEAKSTLDLHGLHVDEAVTVLAKVIEDQRKKLCGRGDKKKDLFIITGRGSHSRGGVARIRPAVMRWLKQNSFNFAEVNEGLLKLRLL